MFRLNASHGTPEANGARIEAVRAAAREAGAHIGVLLDLQGPKIRLGRFANGGCALESGATFIITTESVLGDCERASTGYAKFAQDVQEGDRILLADGAVELKALASDGVSVRTQVVCGGPIGDHKGINLPGVKVSIPSLTEKDLADLHFGLNAGVDVVALSFVRTANDVQQLRDRMGGRPVTIVAKIEKPEAWENIEPVLNVTDGVMVARGDLGVELPPERVPIAQKRIILEANRCRKLVITATQMLDSMIVNPLPTRAEASDVANAIFDGTDAVMLSGETASGAYPVESVTMMDRIVREAETNFPDWGRFKASDSATEDDAIAITRAACELAHDLNVSAIAVFTQTGRTALLMSKMRPLVPIFAFTPVRQVHQRLAGMWGVDPYIVPMGATLRDMVNTADDTLVGADLVRKGKQVVVISGFPVQAVRPPNMALLHTVGEKM